MTACNRVGSVALFLIVGACGSSGGSGSSALTGTVHGQSVSIKDAVSASVTTMMGQTTVHGAAIAMATADDLCADAMAARMHPNEKAVLILLADFNGGSTAAPTTAGTYTIYGGSGLPPAKIAAVSVSVSDATCKPVEAQSASAASGTVTLKTVSGNKFSGSFDVTLDSGDHVTGNFEPGECPELSTLINNSSDPACS